MSPSISNGFVQLSRHLAAPSGHMRCQKLRRCLRRRFLLLLAAVCFLPAIIVFILFNWTDLGRSPPQRPASNKDLRHSHYTNSRGIHVVVGHYYAKELPWEPTPNLTKDILNRNSYSAIPGEGERGEPVYLPTFLHSQAKALYHINKFNLMVSDRIAVNRSLPDLRRPECVDHKYDYFLPTTSVIIVYHNEAWSTLLRTIHSVINRSPQHLLKEIILVDDASDREFLKEPLKNYTATLPVPVHIINLKTRKGLIQARLEGTHYATAEVLTFLDAHCECTNGWLEPLLHRVAQNRSHVVCPVIDIINDETFAYVRSFDLHWGAVNWALHFRWYPIGKEILNQRQQNATNPFKTPIMAGGLFAIDRRYFIELGEYDPEMSIWGGENIELSLRVWMCGGRVEIVPCSRVGHVFRKSSPYDFPGGVGKILYQNLARLAHVWLDEWKNFFFLVNKEAQKFNGSMDVNARKILRNSLNCRSFRWYLENVWPEHFFPTRDVFFGKIRNKKSQRCVRRPQSVGGSSSYNVGKAIVSLCAFEVEPSQLFIHQLNGYITTDENICLSIANNDARNAAIMFLACEQSSWQRWMYDTKKKNLVHISSGLCLALNDSVLGSLALRRCAKSDERQQWILENTVWG